MTQRFVCIYTSYFFFNQKLVRKKKRTDTDSTVIQKRKKRTVNHILLPLASNLCESFLRENILTNFTVWFEVARRRISIRSIQTVRFISIRIKSNGKH